MATRYPISPQHPYKDTYGHNDVNGVETCGVRASGKINWDGQCHQIANRLLYMCSPSISISDIPYAQKPTGYGLTCIMFGAYGVGFKEYCQANNLRVPDANAISLYNFIQGVVQNSDAAVKIVYNAFTLQGATATNAENPQGTDIKAFFQAVQRDGISNSTMATLTNLTETQVIQEQTPERLANRA